MKGIVKGLSALALASAIFAAPAAAQTPITFGVGGGVNIPLSDFSDAAKLGWQGTALVEFAPANLPIGFRVDGAFNRNGFSDALVADVGPGHYQIIDGTANIVYTFQTAEESMFHPYLIAGGGIYNVKASFDAGGSDSESKFGINAGAGFNVMAGGATVFVEGRFHNVLYSDGSDLSMVPVTVGVKFSTK